MLNSLYLRGLPITLLYVTDDASLRSWFYKSKLAKIFSIFVKPLGLYFSLSYYDYISKSEGSAPYLNAFAGWAYFSLS